MLLLTDLRVPFSGQMLVAWVLEQRSLAGPDYTALILDVSGDLSPKQFRLPV